MNSVSRYAVILIVQFCMLSITSAWIINYTDCPSDMQVYPRDLDTDTAIVPVRGTVSDGTPDAIVLRVYRDHVLFSATTQALVFAENTAPFSFESVIAAEKHNYDLEIIILEGADETSSMTVSNVVAGDVFIIQGQSNADSALYNGSASENEEPFLRTFGMNSANGTVTATNLSWAVAKGDGSREVEAGVGQWGLRMGRLLSDAQGIPVAILNGAHDGQPIRFFQRNDTDPDDLDTNYGRLLYRAGRAGITNRVRAVLWYQGESDWGDGKTHEEGFLSLCDDWRHDYPGLEQIYIHQIRVGCGVEKNDVDLRNRQRCFPDRFPYISVMSTTGINGHNGCHYSYENGYKVVGNHIAALLNVDLYGSTNVLNTTAPNIKYMYFSTPACDEITIRVRKPEDPLIFDAAAVNDFILPGSSATVLSGSISTNNEIVLSLSGNASDAEGLAYTGHMLGGAWVTNAAGVGLLTFFYPFAHSTPEPPSMPQNLASSVMNSDRLTLSWDPTSNASSYLIRRDGVDLAVVSSPQYIDSGLDPDTTYQYEIAALNIFGLSSFASETFATLPAPVVVPAVPKGLSGTVLSASGVNLTWDPVTNASVYRVRRNGAVIGTTSEASFTDSAVVPKVDWSYEVRAENQIGNSEYSSPFQINTETGWFFRDDFECNTTVSTNAWPDATDDYDPDCAIVGTWYADESSPTDIQVSSHNGGFLPAAAHSGSNYLIGGYHYETYTNWEHGGLPVANLSSGTDQARIDFWVWGWDGMYSQIVGKELPYAYGEDVFSMILAGAGEVRWNGSAVSATWIPGAWNHVVIDLDLVAGTGAVTINTQSPETLSAFAVPSLGSIRFRGDTTVCYDDIQVSPLPAPPVLEEGVLFQDAFDDNTSANSAAFPGVGDFDPDAPAVGFWSLQELIDEGVQVSGYTGGSQPFAAHSGSNYLVAGYHHSYFGDFGHKGLATANFVSSTNAAVVDFWVWCHDDQVGQVAGGGSEGTVFDLFLYGKYGGEVRFNGGVGLITLNAVLVADSWNHIIIALDLVKDTAEITINEQAAETLSVVTAETIGNLFFRDEHTGYYDDIQVTTIQNPVTGYTTWTELYPALGASTNYADDPDSDGMNNLLEYALGGIPVNSDAANVLPTYETGVEDGTTWLYYIYSRYLDAAIRKLSYSVVSGTNLVSSEMTNLTEEVGSSPIDTDYETVTNRISTDAETQQFMKLTIEINE